MSEKITPPAPSLQEGGFHNFLFILCTLLLIFLTSPAGAQLNDSRSFGPLPIRTQNPLYLQFLSMPLESATTLNQRGLATDAQIAFSNIFEYNPIGSDQFLFDMELWRINLSFKYGISDAFDLQIDTPVLGESGGFLDGLIEGYHNAFGFPNGGRGYEPQNEVHFYLRQNNSTLLDYKRQNLGFGDTTLRLKWHLTEKKNWPVELGMATFLKIPTGEADAGFSSGRADLGTSFFLQKNFVRWHLNSQIGAVWLGGHKFIDDHVRLGFWQFAQSVEWQAFNSTSFLLQLSGNTPALKNFSANPLTDMVLDFTVGLAGAKPLPKTFADELYYSFGFSEDILSFGPSVDFTLLWQVGLRY